MSHLFEIASAGIAEITRRRAPIHTEIGRFSCCSFYSCYCPSLGVVTAAEDIFSPWPRGCEPPAEKKAPRNTESHCLFTPNHPDQELGPRELNFVSSCQSHAEPRSPSTTRPSKLPVPWSAPASGSDPRPAPTCGQRSAPCPSALAPPWGGQDRT